MRISQSNRVSRIPTLSTHQIDHQADLQKSSANIHSRVDDNAFSCHEIDRKGGHDATPARMPRRLAQALGCPNRLSSVDRFLYSRCQSRPSCAWWRNILKEAK